MSIFIIAEAELTFDERHILTVPVRESVSAYEPYRFGNDGPSPQRMLVVIDGRMYRDVIGLVYIDPQGNRQNTLNECQRYL